MMTYRKIFSLSSFAGIPALTLLALQLSSCSAHKDKDADSASESIPPAEQRRSEHADNDIAMTVRSLFDAICVGEPLDSAQYSYVGVLTDGRGTPLYTDSLGAPGEWSVTVADPKSAMIRNLHPGDLLVDDLRAYILQSLKMDDIPTNIDCSDKTTIMVYSSDSICLTFADTKALTAAGAESPRLTISLSAPR